MRFVIDLAHENVARRTGGPFAAAVFRSDDGRCVSAGVNSVMRLNSAVLHAEVVALMFAQARVGSYTLRVADASYELVTSCEPCAMCLGAILWSGVRRLVCGAARSDAERIGFDEGPVFPELMPIWNGAASRSFTTCCALKPPKCSTGICAAAASCTMGDISRACMAAWKMPSPRHAPIPA